MQSIVGIDSTWARIRFHTCQGCTCQAQQHCRLSQNAGWLQLSDECRDLLNRIFVTNEKTRITVAEIKEHPWFKMPLSEEYANAEQRILELQQQHNEYTASRKISTVSSQP